MVCIAPIGAPVIWFIGTYLIVYPLPIAGKLIVPFAGAIHLVTNQSLALCPTATDARAAKKNRKRKTFFISLKCFVFYIVYILYIYFISDIIIVRRYTYAEMHPFGRLPKRA